MAVVVGLSVAVELARVVAVAMGAVAMAAVVADVGRNCYYGKDGSGVDGFSADGICNDGN